MCVHVKLHKYRSRAKIQEFVDKYNNSLKTKPDGRRPLGQMMRQQHTHLIGHLVELFYLDLKRKMALALLSVPGGEFPSFRTNCVQLAQRMNCSERTVRNLRDRLKASGVIAAEKFHGSNSSIEIWLNPDLIHMTIPQNGPNNVSRMYQRPVMASDVETQAAQVVFLAPDLQSLPHTVTSKTNLGTNQLNKLSGADLSPSSDNQSFTVKKDSGECAKPVENPQNDGAKPAIDSTQGTEDKVHNPQAQNLEHPPQFRAAPPQENPSTFEEVAEGLTLRERNRLQRYTERMYRALIASLYADRWIADSERERTLAGLAEYLRYGSPDRWAAGGNEIVTRIGLVARHIKTHYPDGFRMPLPSHYVDVRSRRKVSLVSTKKWFKDHKLQVWDIKNKELLTKAINEYQRSLEPGAKVGPAETYRRIAQRLGKRDQNLFQNFLKSISDAKAA